MNQCEFKEITEEDHGQRAIGYEYHTKTYYDFSKEKTDDGWSFSLNLKSFDEEVAKNSSSDLFKAFVENSKVYQCLIDGHEAGVLHFGFDEWNRRVRIWDILVNNEFRGQGVGSKMIEKVLEGAKSFGARMIVLETQSCNVPAINFYLKHGFDLVGFDALHYTNDDVKNNEIRLEFGLVLE